MEKHAYLIMAHNEKELLKRLLCALDDERNDIYIHIDKKARDIKEQELAKCVNKSCLYFTKRMNVQWGHLTQVKCIYLLLELAIKNEYEYYHLISGVDFPLVTQDSIHKYLSNCGKQFISYQVCPEDMRWKIKYYHYLLRWLGRGGEQGNSLHAIINRKLGEWEYYILLHQEKQGIDRTKKNKTYTYYKGNTWFSITNEFARYVVSCKKEIMKIFFLTNGPDEFFIPTLAMNSKYADSTTNESLRLIDWNRGTPYEFTMNDKDELDKSEAFFVRKISYEKSPELVDWLINRLIESKEGAFI